MNNTRHVIGEGGVPLWTTRAAIDDEPVPWGWLALLTAAALVLRAIGLDSGLWYDEIITLIESVRSPLYSIVTEFPGNNQHTLFSVLAHMSTSVFGEHAWSMRLPSLIFGVAAVPVLYLFAREFVTRLEALLACALLTTAYHHIWFSQNARGYSALACLTLLASWLLLRGLRRGRPIDAVWYGLAAALGVYAHLTMMFLVMSHAMLCAASAVMSRSGDAPRRRWRFAMTAFALAAVFTLLIYSPILLEVKQFFVQHPNRDTPASPGWAVRELIRGLNVGLGTGIGALAAAAFLVAGIRSYLKQSLFISCVFVLPGVVTVGAAMALGRPIFPRFVFFLIGFALLVAVRGVLEVGRWFGGGRAQAGPALVVGLAIVSMAGLLPNYRYPKQDFGGALRYVEEHRAAKERVVTVGLANRIYREYYHRSFENATTLDQLQKIRADGHPMWVLYTMQRYIENRTPDLMRMLRTECTGGAIFKGTVGQGDVTACLIQPVDGRVP